MSDTKSTPAPPPKPKETRGDSLGEIQKMNSRPPAKEPAKKK